MNVFQAAAAVDCTDLAHREGLNGRVTSGGRGSWCCPFHKDDTPSLVTYPADNGRKSHFYCFGCGRHGDAIDLHARLYRQAPLDAARQLCADWGLTYDDGSFPRGVNPPREDKREDDPRLAVVLAICSEWQKYRIAWFEEQKAHSERLLREGCDSPQWRREIEQTWCAYYDSQLKKIAQMNEMEVLADIREEFEALGVNPYRRLRIAGSVS